jgi:hypothetical protein
VLIRVVPGSYARDVDGAGDLQSVRSLECVECGRVSRVNERGWTAYLTTDEDEPAEAVIYRSECAQKEFGATA